MNLIFLDIDGVLNCSESKSRCGGYLGIDDRKVKLLAEIVKQTNAKIILVSSWKVHWEKFYKDEQNELANYLDRKLKRQGLYIVDKTKHYGDERGKEIIEYLENITVNNKWIVLDDEIFPDYEKLGICEHLVKTSFYNSGLKAEHVELAVKLLNELK
ncbi:MAG: hypothetical protein GX272_02445 [Epulopiscium sp.]|nr:hypothetical protein [Candidatus Epulonipiscium sp.]